jgi:hypothetical protein
MASKKAATPTAERIPAVVSQRMTRRMTFFAGIPSLLGMLTFIISYFLFRNGAVKLPTTAVLLVSLLFFGLGVAGLSYGLLSACWDEDKEGSLFGFEQFSLNIGRVREGRREARAARNPVD